MVSKQSSGTRQHVTAIIVYKPQMQQVNPQHNFSYKVHDLTHFINL